MADDSLDRARSLHGANWFLPGGEVNLPAVLEASNVLGELAAEVERLRGALKRVQASAENGAGAGILQCDFINVYVQAVLRGDQ